MSYQALLQTGMQSPFRVIDTSGRRPVRLPESNENGLFPGFSRVEYCLHTQFAFCKANNVRRRIPRL